MIYWRIESIRAEPADHFLGGEIGRLRAAGVARQEESAEQKGALGAWVAHGGESAGVLDVEVSFPR